MKRIMTAAFAIALLGTACGGGGGEIGTDPGAAGVEETARAGIEAVFSSDWSGVRNLLTDDCQEQYGTGDLAAQMTFGLAFAAGFMGIEVEDLERIEIDELVVEDLVEGQSATVRMATSLDGELFQALEEEGDPYVYEGGRWRTAGCDFELSFDE